jgi:hypothetical protein
MAIPPTRFKILYSHQPMHYNGTEINTNIQYQYLHTHDKRMDVAQSKHKQKERDVTNQEDVFLKKIF